MTARLFIMMTDQEAGRWINKILAMAGAIVAAGLVAAALAESSPVRSDHEVSNRTEAPIAVERQFERGGAMMGYEILW
jgi:hypothetical protein